MKKENKGLLVGLTVGGVAGLTYYLVSTKKEEKNKSFNIDHFNDLFHDQSHKYQNTLSEKWKDTKDVVDDYGQKASKVFEKGLSTAKDTSSEYGDKALDALNQAVKGLQSLVDNISQHK
ncbi:hypothetical protein HMPREF9318_00471 [Streptococcus urinalis FB127-CNA-2]|uniref:Uncharacterized protein n=1 Tax=Streptococcus urinalis 2285-97 TaxID=764291 RepID=G5KG63_9STRE|nr:hypothetical protein [Streptococcus urinalis]EHJ56269.1 hypothetical protein STRUR_1224 [Streptococcus urinalis 2285-97]EKS22273.1 hypothetical protein HMPREF9318_00471 [Streptococcus urinalis FB127-CNA-2]VEF32085.1 Protein essC [Streptococcus urinalis]